MRRRRSRGAALGCALALALVAAASGCTKHEALALLDLRSSGRLGASVARFRLTAPGWKTRIITGSLGPEGFRVGYYGPSDGDAVFVTAEALDGVDCVLGRGSASVPALASGGTSEPTTLFIRPLLASGCTLDPIDAGDDAGGEDAGGEDAGGVGEDASVDMSGGGSDTGNSAADAAPDTASPDANTDAGVDVAPDASSPDADEPDPDASTNDAPTTDAGVDGSD